VRKLRGRIVSVHLKDLNEVGPKAHDVPWGTGEGQMDAVLAELRRQKLKAVFSIEYEYKWTRSMPDIAKCIRYFNRAAARLARSK
jgi:sugar phosphate isomerase/epimerase